VSDDAIRRAPHIALALGHRAAMAGHKVRFISAVDRMLQLAAKTRN